MYYTAPLNGRRPTDGDCQRTLADALREVKSIPERTVFRSSDDAVVASGYVLAKRRCDLRLVYR
jgi:hypothetical protein